MGISLQGMRGGCIAILAAHMGKNGGHSIWRGCQSGGKLEQMPMRRNKLQLSAQAKSQLERTF